MSKHYISTYSFALPSMYSIQDRLQTHCILLLFQKVSGLLSILPQPRNGLFTGSSKSLIPNVLTQKPNVKKKTPLPSPLRKLKPDSKAIVTENSDESDDDVQNDFFSFNKPVEPLEPMELPLDLPTKMLTEPKRSKLESYFKKDVVEDPVELQPDNESNSEYAKLEAGSSYSTSTDAETSNNAAMVLDDEAVCIYLFVHALFS